jgi:hypothetical protein
MKENQSQIKGHLDIKIIEESDEFEGKTQTWQEILIHGDPAGLRSFAALLIKIADTNQNEISDLPIGAREHVHLDPQTDLSKSSNQVIIGRLDAKGTGEFYQTFIPKETDNKNGL